ncbi:MAG: glycosyltransferase family 2 protein [bacterium]
MPALSVVMPCHNRAHDLVRVLEAYDRQSGDAAFELIAVDDASQDATPAVLNQYRPSRYTLRVERMPRNAGPATARNRGLDLVQSPLVLIAGDDTVPSVDLVANHLRSHSDAPRLEMAILGRVEWPADMPRNTLMRHVDGPGAQQFSYAHFTDGAEYDYRHLYTANVSLKTDFLRATGMRFDTDFAYAAFEDAELAYRLAARGLRIRYAAAPVAFHYHYHTVWSFARRQYHCGLMADVFARKHPALAHDLRVTKTRLLAGLAAVHLPDRAWQPSRDWTAEVEERALGLANFYEATPHPLLDQLYLHVLDYYWQAGLIDGVFGRSELARRVRDAYAAAQLASQLADFIERALDSDVPLPWPNPRSVHAQLRAARPLLLRSHLVGRVMPEYARRAYEALRWGESVVRGYRG